MKERLSEPEFLTVTDFMTRYRISRTHFYREVNRGAIPIVKVGRLTRIRVADAEAWANNLPVQGASDEAS